MGLVECEPQNAPGRQSHVFCVTDIQFKLKEQFVTHQLH